MNFVRARADTAVVTWHQLCMLVSRVRIIKQLLIKARVITAVKYDDGIIAKY